MLAPLLMVVFIVGWSLATVGLADKQTLALSSINLLYFIHKKHSTISNIGSRKTELSEQPSKGYALKTEHFLNLSINRS